MSKSKEEDLYARKSYDNDARSVDAEPRTDSEDEGSLKSDDVEILNETAEHENLLQQPQRFDSIRGALAKSAKRAERRAERRSRRHSTKQNRRDDGQVMFEMEGGFRDSSSQSSTDIDNDERTIKQDFKKPPRRGLALIHVFIIGLFTALAFGAFKLSRRPKSSSHLRTYWNGTHTFKPTTILVSLDGFRADFLNRDLTPALNAFIASGISPRYMLPSFPSVTFPNHFTLVTGLYPESHGVVGNQFWDPVLQEEFYYTDTKISMQPKWWTAEPIWVTAENQQVRTAIHMWPGSEANIPDIEPTYVDKYNGTETLPRKVDRLLHWLDLPDDEEPDAVNKRPQLMLSYVPNVDSDGHKYGPNSTEIRSTIADVDSMLVMLMEGLLQRNLTEIVNLVVVSDHGMATTSTQRAVQLDDLIDMSLIDHIDGWPLRGLRLKNPDRDVPILHQQLLKAAKENGNFEVYTLDTMPERYHFSNNDRIAPLWVIPNTGWAVLEKETFDLAEALRTGQEYNPKGLHGYDHEHPLMRAIFVARGPAFPHPPNSRVAEFQNTEVYNIICESIGVKPHPNNGTMHLPLQPQGLHSDSGAPQLDTPHDLPLDEAEFDPASTIAETAPSDASTSPAQDESAVADDENKSSSKATWWQFLHDGLEKAKEWAKELVESMKNNKPASEDSAPS